MRNLSFALTTQQVRDRTKTVTRRKGTWWPTVLKPGTRLCAVEKSQGIKRGGLVRICVIEVVSVRVEPLYAIHDPFSYGLAEVRAEGFEGLTPSEFVQMFCGHMGGSPEQVVTRIEFRYVDEATP